MSEKVFIQAYDAITGNGSSIDEIFGNILDKKCCFKKEFLKECQREILISRVDKFEDKDKLLRAKFDMNECVSGDKLLEAFWSIKNSRKSEITIFTSKKVGSEELQILADEAKYSSSKARPFDMDSDGLNATECIAAISLTNKKSAIELASIAKSKEPKEAISNALDMAGCSASDISYVESCADGVPADDRKEAMLLADFFGQKPFVSSCIGSLGYSFEASMLLSLISAAKSMEEGIICASGYLEHSFTNEITFAYANKIKKIELAVVTAKFLGHYCAAVLRRV